MKMHMHFSFSVVTVTSKGGQTNLVFGVRSEFITCIITSLCVQQL